MLGEGWALLGQERTGAMGELGLGEGWTFWDGQRSLSFIRVSKINDVCFKMSNDTLIMGCEIKVRDTGVKLSSKAESPKIETYLQEPHKISNWSPIVQHWLEPYALLNPHRKYYFSV